MSQRERDSACERLAEALPFLDDAADETRLWAQSHALDCPACADLLAAYEDDAAGLERVAAERSLPPGLLDGLADRVLNEVRAEVRAEDRATEVRSPWRLVPLAAAAALLLTAGLALSSPLGDSGPVADPDLAAGAERPPSLDELRAMAPAWKSPDRAARDTAPTPPRAWRVSRRRSQKAEVVPAVGENDSPRTGPSRSSRRRSRGSRNWSPEDRVRFHLTMLARSLGPDGIKRLGEILERLAAELNEQAEQAKQQGADADSEPRPDSPRLEEPSPAVPDSKPEPPEPEVVRF